MHPAYDFNFKISLEDLTGEIRSAFHDVSREGGLSWAQCVALDCYCEIEEAIELAGRPDDESSWNELVDDLRWDPFPGLGGFTFIDPIGLRYYLPAAMIRVAQGRNHEWFDGHLLQAIEQPRDGLAAPLNAAMLKAIARFVAFMANLEITTYEDEGSTTFYIDAFTTHWHKYLTESH